LKKKKTERTPKKRGRPRRNTPEIFGEDEDYNPLQGYGDDFVSVRPRTISGGRCHPNSRGSG